MADAVFESANGDGRVNSIDCNLFLASYNKPFTGFATTISWRAQPFRGSGRLA